MSGIDNIAWLNNDPDFEDFLKKRTHVREESLGRVERFLSKKYFKDVTYSNTRTQQVVIKIPNKGYGAKHLHYLTKYIARELSSQENEQSQIVYNQDGDIVGKDDFVNVVEEWSKDFPSENSELSEEASNVLNEFKRQEAILQSLKQDGLLSEEHKDFALNLRKFNDRRKLSNTLNDGDLIKDNISGTIGFVDFKDNQGLSIKSIDDEGNILRTDISHRKVENVGKVVKESIGHLRADFTHMILSTGGDNPDKDDALKATYDFLKDNLTPKGYDFLLARHDDTDHLHFHVIVRSQSRHKDERPFRLNKFDLQDLRESYTEHLDRYEIDRSATFEFDRQGFINSLINKAEMLTDKESWFKYKMDKSDNPYFDAVQFKERALKDIEYLAGHLDKQGFSDQAKLVRGKAESFKTDAPEVTSKLVDYTVNFIERDLQTIEKKYKDILIDRISDGADLDKDKRSLVKTMDSYSEYLDKSIKDLKEIPKSDMNEEIQRRQQAAVTYLEENKKNLDQSRDKIVQLAKGDKGNVIDTGMERER